MKKHKDMLSHRGIPFFVYPRKEAHGTFYYRFKHGETNHHKSTKTDTESVAILRAIEAIDKVLGIEAPQSPVDDAQRLIASKVVPGYIETRMGALRPSTVRSVKHFFKDFLDRWKGTKLPDIQAVEFQTWMNQLREKTKPATSYWRDRLTRYDQFFRWAIQADLMAKNPLLGYPRPPTSAYNVYEELVEEGEFQTLCAHISPSDEFAVRCFRYMGIYPMDYAFAEKQDFFLQDGVLTFYRKRSKNNNKFNQPLDGRIEPAIKAIWLTKKHPTDRMFTDIPTEPEQAYKSWYQCLEKRLRKTWEVCGLGKHKKIGAFRHTFLTECIERGVPEDVVLAWGGYSKGSTVLRRVYLHRKSTARYRYVPDSPSTSPALLHQ